MANKLNLKAVFSADTSDIEKGAKRARQSVKDFEDGATEGVNAFGNALGVNIGVVQKFSSSVEGAFRSAANAAGFSAEKIASMGSAFTAMAGVAAGAIAAVKLGLSELNSYADRFEQTLAGQEMKAGSQAFVDTFNAAVLDMMPGEEAARVRNGWKEFWGTIGSTSRLAFSSGALSGGQSWSVNTTGISDYTKQLNEANKLAERGREIRSRMVELEKKYSDEQTRVALKENEIAELKLKARNDTVSMTERQKAQNEAISQTQTLYDGIIAIQQERLELLKEFNALTNSGLDDYKAENALVVENAAYSKRVNDAQRELLEYKRTLANLAAAQAKNEAQVAAAIQQQKQAAEALAKLKTETPQLTSINSLDSIMSSVKAEIESKEIIARPVVSVEPELEMVNIDPTFALGSAISGIADSIGGIIADLATGTEISTDSLIQSFGAFARQLGEIVMSAGLAGITLKSLAINPWAAVAAGAALIALGSAVSAGVNNLTNNSYSASAYTGGQTYSRAETSDYITNSIDVNVKGTLVASGSQLVAVLNNENNRKQHTT